MMPSSEYKIVVETLPPEDGGGFLALVPELPGCMSDGETEADAIRNAQDAIAAWIAHAASKGQNPPKPMRQRYYGS
jgi:antitoxin HicB